MHISSISERSGEWGERHKEPTMSTWPRRNKNSHTKNSKMLTTLWLLINPWIFFPWPLWYLSLGHVCAPCKAFFPSPKFFLDKFKHFWLYFCPYAKDPQIKRDLSVSVEDWRTEKLLSSTIEHLSSCLTLYLYIESWHILILYPNKLYITEHEENDGVYNKRHYFLPLQELNFFQRPTTLLLSYSSVLVVMYWLPALINEVSHIEHPHPLPLHPHRVLSLSLISQYLHHL